MEGLITHMTPKEILKTSKIGRGYLKQFKWEHDNRNDLFLLRLKR